MPGRARKGNSKQEVRMVGWGRKEGRKTKWEETGIETWKGRKKQYVGENRKEKPNGRKPTDKPT